MNEYSFPFFFLDEKNETVKGIIGNTQGVNKARNPPIKPMTKPQIGVQSMHAKHGQKLFCAANFLCQLAAEAANKPPPRPSVP